MIPRTAELYGHEVRRRLLEWFDANGRFFPWRSIERARKRGEGEAIHDPYLILVSEVMLQQTQTSRVVVKLPEFMERFPDVERLAAASRAELLRAWQGMGYNSRALRLQETARELAGRFGGEFPRDSDMLRSLPGIGPYTAAAILCFAFGQDVPLVDVNVARVLSRIFHRCYSPAQIHPESRIRKLAGHLVPEGDAYRWHQTLMDFGALICTGRAPACDRCPLSDICLSAFVTREPPLFNPASIRKSEPSFRGEPRRLWRGRIVESLRGEPAGLRVDEIMTALIPGNLLDPLTELERREFLAIVAGLISDGLAERAGAVHEGGLQEWDVVRLPEI